MVEKNPYTTWFGGFGQGLTGAAMFVPPPFNMIPLGLGALLSGVAFYMAADAKPVIVTTSTGVAS
jgi:hypothetical protein